MSGYQRLISYIYAYEGGIKGKNIGFAKIENRGSQCRIMVNVKKIFVGGNPVGIYLMAGREEVRIGTLFARGNAGEFRTVVNAQDVEGSGRRMEEFFGLTVHDTESTWRSYTTIWEDAVAHAAEIELADVTSEKIREKEAIKEEKKGVDPENGESGNRKSDEETDEKKQNGGIGGAAKEPELPDYDAKEPEPSDYTAKDSEFLEAVVEKTGVSEPMVEEPGMPEAIIGESGDSEHVEGESGVPWDDGKRPEIPGHSTGEGENQQKFPISEEIERELEREELNRLGILKIREKNREPIILKTQRESEREAGKIRREVLKNRRPTESVPSSSIPVPFRSGADTQKAQEIWEMFRGKYSKILAFDYADGCEILAIKPQDIGLLPRENWVYGNNSFLLHGYYNYRHLILARLNQPGGGGRYLLGVPGHYQSNERYMASMFGFSDFVLSKRQPPRDSRFGYWYTDIQMGN